MIGEERDHFEDIEGVQINVQAEREGWPLHLWIFLNGFIWYDPSHPHCQPDRYLSVVVFDAFP